MSSLLSVATLERNPVARFLTQQVLAKCKPSQPPRLVFIQACFFFFAQGPVKCTIGFPSGCAGGCPAHHISSIVSVKRQFNMQQHLVARTLPGPSLQPSPFVQRTCTVFFLNSFDFGARLLMHIKHACRLGVSSLLQINCCIHVDCLG